MSWIAGASRQDECRRHSQSNHRSTLHRSLTPPASSTRVRARRFPDWEGAGALDLHRWVFELEAWPKQNGEEGGQANASTPVLEEARANVGATVMGRKMFGGGTGPWSRDPPWNGWWGDDPPFHTPVFVLTHHPREPLEMQGGTTFIFVTEGIESALQPARQAADGRDCCWEEAPASPSSTSPPG